LLVWDVTVVSRLAASYVNRAATDAGTVADMAASRKEEKYTSLSTTYIFEPIAVENLEGFSSFSLHFISELGHWIHTHSADVQEGLLLFQCITIAVQCFCKTLIVSILDS